MTIEVTYTQARANLAGLLNTVTDDREIIIIKRRNAEDTALISADEIRSLLETAHLLRSPANAARLLTALNRAIQNELAPTPLDELRRAIGLDDLAYDEA